MPARDHVGECLPPAESHAGVTVEPGEDNVFVETHGLTALSEPQTRWLIGELSAAWSRAFRPPLEWGS